MLVFGKESVGLAPEIRERYRDRMVRIPMVDPRDPLAQSLDVGGAGGV